MMVKVAAAVTDSLAPLTARPVSTTIKPTLSNHLGPSVMSAT